VSDGTTRLLVMGWLSVIVVAIAMAIVRGQGEYGPAAVFGAVGVGMALWVWRRRSRASAVVSLVLGVLWTVQFAAYAAASVVADEFEPDVFAIDAFAVVGGIVLLTGAARAVMEARRDRSVRAA
jgi:hypothetical protein